MTWTIFELNILNAIQNIRNPILDSFFIAITSLGDASIFWIAFTILCLSTKEYKNMGKIMIIAFILNMIIVNLLLKNIVGRVRPYNYIDDFGLLIQKLGDGSFPSGHSSYAFSFATIVAYMGKGKAIKIFTGVLAILIAFSRLYLFVHFPSDVISGAIIGYLISYLIIKSYYLGKFKFIFTLFKLQSQ